MIAKLKARPGTRKRARRPTRKEDYVQIQLSANGEAKRSRSFTEPQMVPK